MSYRDDLTALAARHDALATEVAHKTRELEQATAILEDAQARAMLPVLDNIKVAAPCAADWGKMAGDDRVRHCGDCKKNVFNLSDMTRAEAEALIVEKQGKLCVRYFQRADGTILTKDCPVGVARRRKRRLVAAGAIAMLAGGGVLVWRSLRPNEVVKPPVENVELFMGAIAPPPPPPVIELETTTVVPDVPVIQDELMGDVAVDPPAVHKTMGKVKLVR